MDLSIFKGIFQNSHNLLQNNYITNNMGES